MEQVVHATLAAFAQGYRGITAAAGSQQWVQGTVVGQCHSSTNWFMFCSCMQITAFPACSFSGPHVIGLQLPLLPLLPVVSETLSCSACRT
jgi:hypothetical protein